MYDMPHQYDLAYMFSQENMVPELVFVIDAKHEAEFAERLFLTTTRLRDYARKYCGVPVEFTQPTPDLFGDMQFGYNRCGYARRKAGKLSLYVCLRSGRRTRHAALTVYVLAIVLYPPFSSTTNQVQQLLLETNAVAGMHGHSISGYIASTVVSWLAKYHEQAATEADRESNVPIPLVVVKAMQETWQSVALSKMKTWKKDCWGRVKRNGSFTIGCFGDACDLGIYPDQLPESNVADKAVQFGCHNLDDAPAQLTLLAGLAVLCQLARESS